ncbi:hypothetical protein BGZ65_012618, partial [Modicella reniformis]
MLSLTRPVVFRATTASIFTTAAVLSKEGLARTATVFRTHTLTQSTSRLSTVTHSTIRPNPSSSILSPLHRRIPLKVSVPLVALVAGTVLYGTIDSFKHRTLALQRVLLAAEAVVVTGYDYKLTLSYGSRDLKAGDPEDEQERRRRKNRLHKRSAERVMTMMKRNGGIFIKLGQHLASLKYLLPEEWTKTMEPLQDRCLPSSMESIQGLFLSDLGQPLSEVFSSFDLTPIGVASLAQVHRATLRDGREVAVKIQHPNLSEFSEIDMKTIAALAKFIAYTFPEF